MIESTPVQQPTQQTFDNVGLYNPLTIILMSVLFSCFSGSVIAAVNWRRLQQPRRFWLTLIVGLVALLFVAVGNPLFALYVGTVPSYVVLLAVNLVFGIALALWQRPIYQVWRATQSDNRLVRRPSGCGASIAIILGSIVVAVIFIVIIGLPLLSVVLSLRPIQTYRNQDVMLTYPGTWIADNMQTVEADLCNQPDQQCLFEAAHLSDGLTIDLIRLNNIALRLLPLQQVDTATWAAIQTTSSLATLVSTKSMQINGHDAIERVYNDSLPDRGLATRLLLLIKEDSGSILRFEAVGPPDGFFQDQKEIDSIISTIHLTTAQ